MKVTSKAFRNGGRIPLKYSGEGLDISPPLHFSDVPDKTGSLVVICHDPDAPLIKPDGYGYVHWVLYNIPGKIRALEEGTKNHTAGINDAQKKGYSGPMPPKKHGKHRYYFLVLALKKQMDLKPFLPLNEVLRQVEPYVIAVNRLVGTYKRK